MVTERLRRGPAPRSLEERLWEKVDRNGPTQPHMDSACWEFIGGRNYDGYGIISLGRHCGRMIGAHRAAWIVTNGPIPDGLKVLHRCDNPACVRAEPDGKGHLFLGTQSDNMLDCSRKGRLAISRVAPKNIGTDNGRARLTPEQVASIRARYKTVATARQLAEEYGVSVFTIRAAGQGRTWRHLEEEPVPKALEGAA